MITPETTNILEIIPQRQPFVMVDQLLHYDQRVVRTRFDVQEDNVMVSQSGTFGPYGLLENIAQSCAARIGYRSLINDEPIAIGVIGAVKNFVVGREPGVGETINTTIEILNEVFGITLVAGSVYVGEELVASCQMKIALNN